MDENTYLSACEAGHRQRCGEFHYCYVAVAYRPGSELWRMAITADDLDGYMPISDDLFLGDEREMVQEAKRLNKDRLGLSAQDAAGIIAASMARSPNQRHNVKAA